MSHGTCPTVRIKAEVTDDNPLGYVVINKEDFDAETHELFEAEPEPAPSGEEPSIVRPVKPVWEQ